MNPVSIQYVYRAESGQRAKLYAEIQLINQAHPRGSREPHKQLGVASLIRESDAARRIRAWLSAVRTRRMNAADPAQPVREPGAAR